MGGNVFTDTSRIDKKNIEPTLRRFFKELHQIFPNAPINTTTTTLLGSAGKVESSGDIDLGFSVDMFNDINVWNLDPDVVDGLYKQYKSRARTSTDKQIRRRAILAAIAKKVEEQGNNLEVNTKQAGSGTLFFKFPQYTQDEEQDEDKKVQIDVNVGNLEWLKFSYFSDSYKEKNIKGLHRTQLIVALLSNKDYIFYHNTGVKNKETGKIEAADPEAVVKLLSNLYSCTFTLDILSNYWKLDKFIEEHLNERDLKDVYQIYLGILDHTKDVDIPDGNIMNYWLDYQNSWNLTGRFLPKNSKLFAFKDEN